MIKEQINHTTLLGIAVAGKLRHQHKIFVFFPPRGDLLDMHLTIQDRNSRLAKPLAPPYLGMSFLFAPWALDAASIMKHFSGATD